MGAERPGRETDRSPQPSIDVKREKTATPPVANTPSWRTHTHTHTHTHLWV
jgi:hypothetical protein